MAEKNAKSINVAFPVSFHLWIKPRATNNARAKCSEIKMLCTEMMKINPVISGLEKQLLEKHTESVKWASLVLPLSFHLWLEERVKNSERTKAEELKLLCLWMQQREGEVNCGFNVGVP